MLVDRYGKNLEIDDWFIRLDQNDEGRLYRVEGYPAPGKIAVHEHRHKYASEYSSSGPCIQIIPARLKQTINMPRRVLWYPFSLLPEVGPREE
ncbi:hypothetical protein D3C76_78150 [compost metagenome]